MDKTVFSARQILAGEAPADRMVTVKGWVRTRRDSRAGISFVHVSDGSSFHPAAQAGDMPQVAPPARPVAQREAEIEPNRVLDNRRRKAVAAIRE